MYISIVCKGGLVVAAFESSVEARQLADQLVREAGGPAYSEVAMFEVEVQPATREVRDGNW
jgi:hypothetical protein